MHVRNQVRSARIDYGGEPPIRLPIGGICLAEQDCALMRGEAARGGMLAGTNGMPFWYA